MPAIRASVGNGGVNNLEDVAIIRSLLVRHARWLGRHTIASIGEFDNLMRDAIVEFQKGACALANPKGLVEPNSFTRKRLSMALIPYPTHQVFAKIFWCRPRVGLSKTDFQNAAKKLGCELHAIQAVSKVETRREPWYSFNGKPTILYERHKFKSFTHGAFDKTHPDISGPAGGYGKHSEQYGKLFRAAVLNESAALKSASWGAFQIMGFNYKAAGYESVEKFVSAILENEANHLKAFVNFIQSTPSAKKGLQDKDWHRFAIAYNGAGQSGYDKKISSAYKALEAMK